MNHVLAGVEQQLPLIEKFSYALLIDNRKLRPYFESHRIIVLINQSLQNALGRCKSSKRMIKYVSELASYEINYESKRVIKAQALADFLIECSISNEPRVKRDTAWMLYVAGSATNERSEVGLVMVSPK